MYTILIIFRSIFVTKVGFEMSTKVAKDRYYTKSTPSFIPGAAIIHTPT